MFTNSAELYDRFYSWKNYEEEAALVHNIIQAHMPGARTLLDVACGTGQHLHHLHHQYEVHGLDIDAALLQVARRRLPQTPLYQQDMTDFSLEMKFDAITCLFSSIGYLLSEDLMQQAVTNMAAHLRADGVLLIEPWLSPDEWVDGHVAALFIDEPQLKATRMNVGRSEGRLSVLDFHYLVATPEGVEHFTEEHRLYLFTDAEYRHALSHAGLDVHYDEEGLEGRGLYVGSLQATARNS